MFGSTTLDIRVLNARKTPSMKSTKKRIELDWRKLLGFNQVKATKGERKAAKAMIGAKIGAKVGLKKAA